MQKRSSAELALRLGLSGPPDAQFEQALTHGSENQKAGNSHPTNRELAFVGDAVIELVCRARESEAGGDLKVGVLSRNVDQVTRNSWLAVLARNAQLGEYLRVGDENIRDETSVLATALEAVLGAVFTIQKFEVASRCAVLFLDNQLAPVPTTQGPSA